MLFHYTQPVLCWKSRALSSSLSCTPSRSNPHLLLQSSSPSCWMTAAEASAWVCLPLFNPGFASFIPSLRREEVLPFYVIQHVETCTLDTKLKRSENMLVMCRSTSNMFSGYMFVLIEDIYFTPIW